MCLYNPEVNTLSVTLSEPGTTTITSDAVAKVVNLIDHVISDTDENSRP